MTLAAVTLLSFIIALLSVRALRSYAVRQGLMDIPNARSSHDVPTPRGGGLGLLVGIGMGAGTALAFGLAIPGWSLWVGALFIAVVGYLDDRKPLPVYLRLSIQVGIAAGVYGLTGGFQAFPLPAPLNADLNWLALPLNVIWMVGVINLFNFLDGIDGYAGSQALLAGLGLALLTQSAGLTTAGLVIAAAALGFLVFNWHPARIFMGDSGSATLGFLFACLPYYADQSSSLMTYYMALLLWFFLADGAFTLIRRASRGERIWEAHRSHLYQRLVISGLSHAQVTLLAMTGTLLIIGALAIGRWSPVSSWWSLSLAVLLFLAYQRYTTIRERATTTQTPASADQ